MRIVGAKGEKIAVDFLLSQGYQILAKNYACRGGEIDLVTAEKLPDKNVLAFVEVKYYKENSLRDLRAAVDPAKQKRIIRTARHYLQANKLNDSYVRFDAVLISFSPNNAVQNIELIKDAFRS
ncbi:MAG: YraN family protein [Candidatus Margulisbacteria bacterium]|jgi:putative endonuclease|nr:YraN family protein [Candidatus Margulisiibacteriota bacterium]